MIDADYGGTSCPIGVHRVVGFTAVNRPVAGASAMNFDGAQAADRHVDRRLRSAQSGSPTNHDGPEDRWIKPARRRSISQYGGAIKA